MNGSNNFNVCPRCGNSNALSAKFCARCGQQLKMPEEAVICHKCGTRNTPLANYCRSCGTTLKVGLQTKICPKCGKEVEIGQSVCECGYGFANLSPVTPAPTEQTEAATETSATAEVQSVPPTRVHGRAFAIVATVILALFTFFIVAPAMAKPDFLIRFDGAMLIRNGVGLYATDFVSLFIEACGSGGSFGGAIDYMGGFGSFVEFLMSVAVIIAITAHTIVCITRICTQKRSKRPNWLYLILAGVCTILCGLLAMGQYVDTESGKLWSIVAKAFSTGGDVGAVTYLIPAYFLFFFFYSLVARVKVKEEDQEPNQSEQ